MVFKLIYANDNSSEMISNSTSLLHIRQQPGNLCS